MNKVVINTCYGGFSLSEAGMRRYAEIKGITLYVERDEKYGAIVGPTFWLIPEEERLAEVSPERWAEMSLEARQAWNEQYSGQTLSCRDFARHDPVLVQVVEELGSAANNRFSQLEVVEIEGRMYRIDEYDGMEGVEVPDSIEWVVI